MTGRADAPAQAKGDGHRRVIVVGSGPAGYTAALYTGRAALRPLVFEGPWHGGALMNTTEVENFPGFPQGIMGPDLMRDIRSQSSRFGTDLVADEVTSVDLRGPVKVVRTTGSEYTADTVILATGSAYRELGVPGEKELSGRGVSWCATCDGFFFRGREIAVVGGGDTAMEEATFLTRFASSVTIVHRRAQLRASRIMAQRARSNPKIRWALQSEVAEVLGTDGVEAVRLRDTASGVERRLDVGGLFVAIGHVPRSEMFAGQLSLDGNGYVQVQAGTARTSVAGVFAAGDVVDHVYRQAVTAAGSGCQAALDTERYLSALDDSAGRHGQVPDDDVLVG